MSVKQLCQSIVSFRHVLGLQSSGCRIILGSENTLRIFFAHLFALAKLYPCPRYVRSFSGAPLENAFAITLTNLLPSEVLESGSQRSIDVMILSQKAVLSWVAKWVEFVAPMASKVEPRRRRNGVKIG